MKNKKNITRLFFLLVILSCRISFLHAQQIVNIVLVGKDGITEDIKKADNFIVIKSYPNGEFERIEYVLRGPIIQLRTYSDSTLTVLSGRTFKYTKKGNLTERGHYTDNLKTGHWQYLNDAGKVIKTELYEKGVLIDPDVKDSVNRMDTKIYGDERQAVFNQNDKEWKTYLEDHLDLSVVNESVEGGEVIVEYMINTNGNTDNIHLVKSVEFVLDEAVIKVIQDSPQWIPAFQNGKTLKAYRRQPITFYK